MRPLGTLAGPAALAALVLLAGCSDAPPPATRTVTVTAPSASAATVTVTAAAPWSATTAVPRSGDWSATTPTTGRPPRTTARTTARTMPPPTARAAPPVTRATPQPDSRALPAPAPRSTARAAGVRVPRFLGDSLTAAYARLTDLGVPRNRRSPHDVSGKTRTVLNPDNWQVCTQRPAAGSAATAQTVYQFGVVKFGERCP